MGIFQWFWDLEAHKGHRSNICRWGISITGLMTAYQGAVLSGELANLPLIPSGVLIVSGAAATFLANKMKKFIKEPQMNGSILMQKTLLSFILRNPLPLQISK